MVDLGSSDPVQWKKKGDRLYKSGNYFEAIQSYRKAIEFDPDYIAAWDNLGHSFLKLGKNTDARLCFEKKEQLALLRRVSPSETAFRLKVQDEVQKSVISENLDNSLQRDEKFSEKLPDTDFQGAASLREERVAADTASMEPLRRFGSIITAQSSETQVKMGISKLGWRQLPFSMNHFSINNIAFYFLFFLITIILFAYIVPLIFSPIPSGTDVYLHMVSTERMYQSDSLVDFIEKSRYQESLLYDYPFGMWYIGSIIMKITGINVSELVILFPLILVLMSFIVYYVYAYKLLRKKEWAILSLIFIVSMPFLAINLLNFQTSRFISVFLIMIFLLIIDEEKKWQNIILVIAIPFTLAITHTGTYLFLIVFTTSYFLLYALIWEKFDWWVYGITATTIFMYVVAVQEFQFVQPQYVDKGRLVISVTEKLASTSGFDIISDMGSIFYDNIFVTNSMSYVVFWSAMIFSIGMMALWTHRKIKRRISSFGVTLPLIGSINNISHGIVATPFWIGPVQTVLSIFGFFKLNSKGKCIFLALIISAIIPASMQSDTGTGSLREIYYLFLIIPITAAAGMMVVYPKLQQFCNSRKKRILFLPILSLIFLPLIIAPIVGSIYYIPQISGTENERENLMWLGMEGSPQEGVAEFGYRERIDIYAQKESPDIPQGTETRQYLTALRNVYFSVGSEKSVDELFSDNIHYLISSERILNAMDVQRESLRIDTNTRLDKIFSSDDQFGIYQVNKRTINQVTTPVNETVSLQQIRFDNEQSNIIQDAGSSYLIESRYYKVRISKMNPSIIYLGTDLDNMLGEGIFSDHITIHCGDRDNAVNYYSRLSEITYNSVVSAENTIVYKGFIKNEDSDSNLATINIIYTFFEKAMKLEVQIANDQINNLSAMNVYLGTNIVSPASSFDYIDKTDEGESEVNKRFYPSQDSIPIRDAKTNRIFLNQQGKGILIYYDDLSPYPDRITYKGSEVYDYGSIYIQSEYSPPPGDFCQFVRYIAVGEKQTSIRNIEECTAISLYDYPEGIIPFIVVNPHSNGKTAWNDFLKNTIPTSMMFPYTVTSSWGMKEYTSQKDELSKQSIGQVVTGVIIPDLQYNLYTIKALNDNSLKGLAGFPVNPPAAYLFKEGRRNLKEAYYKGEQTDVILIPVSLPQSSIIGRGGNQEEIFDMWYNVIDSVVLYDNIAVFFWYPEDFNSVNLQEKASQLIRYADEKGMTITTLDSLIAHKILLKNIVINVEKNVDTVILEIWNNNKEQISGMTCKVILPEITGDNDYKVSEGGRIVRVDRESNYCILYVACDLERSEVKRLIIEPTEERKRFGIDFTKLYHGTNTMVIRDDMGNRVSGASVTVDTRSHLSNAAGEVTFYARRGVTNISVEKAGFRPRNVQIDIKSKISGYFDNIMGKYSLF